MSNPSPAEILSSLGASLGFVAPVVVLALSPWSDWIYQPGSGVPGMIVSLVSAALWCWLGYKLGRCIERIRSWRGSQRLSRHFVLLS